MWWLVLTPCWLATTLFFRAYRIWLPYYVLATGGCAYGLVVGTRQLFAVDVVLGQMVAWAVHRVAAPLGITTELFAGAPNALLVMVVSQDVGWTLLNIGVESSGLLELAVLVSLLLFYPSWTLRQRLMYMLLGVCATLGANVLRILIIISVLHGAGKPALVLAHSFLGRALFFGCTVAIYWYLLTRPTVRAAPEAA